MSYKAVVFDLDGTLLDTIEDLTDAVNMTMRHYGWPEHTIAQVKTYVGNGVGWLVECAVPGGKTNPLFEEALEIQKQNYAQVCENKTRPYDGIMEVIRKLKEYGYKLSIVSNKGQEAVEALRKLYFSDVIEVAIGERDGIRRKPAPDTAFEAVKRMGADIETSVYVGDSEVDLATARNAGMDCISVSWGFRPKQLLIENGAKVICDTPEDLLNVLIDDLYSDIDRYISRNYYSEQTICRESRLDAMYKCGAVHLEEMEMALPGGSGRSLKDLVDNPDESFSDMLLRLIDEKGYTDTEIYKRANIDRKLFSKIRCNSDYNPSKKTVIALCLALRLSLDETLDLMNAAGFGLSHSSKTDIIFEYFIDNGIYDLYRLNEALVHFGEKEI